jgi:hypothetical protein
VEYLEKEIRSPAPLYALAVEHRKSLVCVHKKTLTRFRVEHGPRKRQKTKPIQSLPGRVSVPPTSESIRVPFQAPPPGRALTFVEWSTAIVEGVRRAIPEIRASRRGERIVLLRLGDQLATLLNDGATFVITFGAAGTTTMASLHDRERRDAFTCQNFVRSIAGYFDARLAVRQP